MFDELFYVLVSCWCWLWKGNRAQLAEQWISYVAETNQLFCCCESWRSYTERITRAEWLAKVAWCSLTLNNAKVIIVPHRIIWSWYTGRWWVGCYIRYSEEGTGLGRSPPIPLLAVPNVTAHPSTASVPITVLLHSGPLLCGFCRAMLYKRGLCRHAVSVCLSVCLLCSWILSKRINISSNIFTVG